VGKIDLLPSDRSNLYIGLGSMSLLIETLFPALAHRIGDVEIKTG
jgi:hypothetical protein